VAVVNITPKCGSLSGNCKVELTLNIDLKDKYSMLRDYDL